jgi:outer membrane protein assembly factor BamB
MEPVGANMLRLSSQWLLIACALSPALGAEIQWPQFRGGPAAGVASEGKFPETWDKSKNVLWKTAIPGMGWSSPIIWGDKIFITSVITEGKTEDPRKGLYFGGERAKPPEGEHRWMVYCLDFQSGKILWEQTAHKGIPASGRHIKNSYASETSITDGERVYAYFGNLGMFCYDMNGKERWTWKSGSFKTFAAWGTAASPALHGRHVFVVNDNEEKSFLVALDKYTGEEVWRVSREERSNWATPFVWTNDQRTEIVTAGKGKVRSYDLNGKLLWEFKGMSSITIPTPFARHGLLYVSSGYVLDKTRPVYAIRPGAEGDISLKEDETSSRYMAWCNRTAGPYNPSPIVYGDYLYVLYDMGTLACFDAHTGKEVYGKKRIGASANSFTASPWAANGKLFCLSEEGDTFVIEAGTEFKLLGKNSLEEMCLATPALAGDSLLIRTASTLYRIRQDR